MDVVEAIRDLPLAVFIRARQKFRRAADACKGERCQSLRCRHLDGPIMKAGSDVYTIPAERTYLQRDIDVCWACAGDWVKPEEVIAASVLN